MPQFNGQEITSFVVIRAIGKKDTYTMRVRSTGDIPKEEILREARAAMLCGLVAAKQDPKEYETFVYEFPDDLSSQIFFDLCEGSRPSVEAIDKFTEILNATGRDATNARREDREK